MKDRILVSAPLPQQTLNLLRDRFELIEAWVDTLGFLKTYSDAAAIRVVLTIGNKALTREMIELLPSLRHICHYGVGHDLIDTAAVRERNVLLTNTAGSNSSCVADLAMTLLGACIRQLCIADRGVRNGAWARKTLNLGLTPHLAGRKLGIYGLGDIGSKIARRAAAFEMEVGYHGRSPKPGVDYRYFSSLLSLATWADDLMVAVKATDSTARSVNSSVLAALGPRGYLVNVARGSVVAEGDLVAALGSGMIAGAGLDVFENEPDVRGELTRFDNVILTPHMGSNTSGALHGTDQIFLSNLERYYAGLPPLNVVV